MRSVKLYKNMLGIVNGKFYKNHFNGPHYRDDHLFLPKRTHIFNYKILTDQFQYPPKFYLST